MQPEATPIDRAQAPAAGEAAGSAEAFEQLYQVHFAFVWRSLRRLGVSAPALDDAAQEVFLVVHRRMAALDETASRRAWLFGITSRVASEFRRTMRRKDPSTRSGQHLADPDSVADPRGEDPLSRLEEADAARVLCELLDELEWQKREVFVLVELEEMSVPEIAEALGINQNTVYSRVRAARQAFNDAVARFGAREQWRTR